MNSVIKTIKTFFKTSLIFFAGTILSKVVSFFMIPLYTKFIDADVMGTFDLFLTYTYAIIPILFVEIWSAIIRFLYDSGDKNYRNKVISSQFKVFKISLLVGTIISLLLNYLFKIEGIFYVSVISLASAITYIYQFSARGFRDNYGFAISGIINTIVLSTCNYILITNYDLGINALVLSYLLGSLAQVSFLEYRIRLIYRIFRTEPDTLIAKEMIKYSIPLGINSLSFWLLTSSNKVIVNYILGASANGIYAISQKFSGLVAFLTMGLNFSWQDIAFSRKNKDDGEFYSKAINYFALFLTIGGVMLILISKYVAPRIIHPNYSRSIELIPYGILATLASAVSTFMGNIFAALKKTKNMLVSTFISSFINIVLTYLLVMKIGIQGANIALLISFVINILIRTYLLTKFIKVKLDYRLIILIILLVSVSIYIY